jgi:thiol-disulfide isomerase/thioredoxin
MRWALPALAAAWLLAACGGGGSSENNAGSAGSAGTEAPRPPAIRARTGALELPAGDGVGAGALSPAEYDKQYRPLRSIVAARELPELSPAARLGINMIVDKRNVSWVVDRDAAGWWLAYDADADGDLREEPHLRFTGTDLMLSTPGDVRRFRVRGDALFVQHHTIRRGTFEAGGRTYRFALLGQGGIFGHPHQALAIDFNGDGALDLEADDGPELLHLFEGAVRIGDAGYTMNVSHDGATLELVPLEHPPPPRPALVENTPAPTFRATARDGSSVALEDLRGSVVLLDFWARGCKPCIVAMPRLRGLAERHRHLRVVGVAATEDGDATGLELPGTQIHDRDDQIQSRYRVAAWPTYFLVGRDGRIACARCALDDIEAMIPRL